MSEEALNQMVGWALVDKDFRHQLLTNPAGVSTRFDLTPEERRALCDIQANSIEQLAKELCRWIRNDGSGNGHRPLDKILKMRILAKG